MRSASFHEVRWFCTARRVSAATASYMRDHVSPTVGIHISNHRRVLTRRQPLPVTECFTHNEHLTGTKSRLVSDDSNALKISN